MNTLTIANALIRWGANLVGRALASERNRIETLRSPQIGTSSGM